MSRTDLIGERDQADNPVFDASVRTATPWGDVMEFFGESPGTFKPGGLFQESVHYLSRPLTPNSTVISTALLARLDDDRHRRWFVNRARRLTGDPGATFETVALNHKLHQYNYQSTDGWWVGSADFPDYATWVTRDDTIWSGEPIGYGFFEYLRGWMLFSRELAAKRVPFHVLPNARWWDEANVDLPGYPDTLYKLQDAALRASILFLETSPKSGWGWQEAEYVKVANLLRARGKTVVEIDSDAGLLGE